MKRLQTAVCSTLFLVVGATSLFSQDAKSLTVESVSAEIKASPTNPALYLKRAGVWFSKGDFLKAIADYTEAAHLNPKDATPFAYRGLAYEKLNKEKQAIADYTKATRLNPGWDAPYGYLADMSSSLGQYENANRNYTKVIQLNPRSPQAYLLRGDCYSKQGADEKAIADYSYAITLQPKWILPYSSRADSWCNLKQYGKALDDYNAAIQIAPKESSCYEERSWLLSTCPNVNVRNGKQALLDSQYSCKLIGWDKLDCTSMDTLAAAYAEAGQFKDAVQWQEKAIACSPSKGNEHYQNRLKLYRSGKAYRE